MNILRYSTVMYYGSRGMFTVSGSGGMLRGGGAVRGVRVQGRTMKGQTIKSDCCLNAS